MSKYLITYLQDHMAGSVAAVELLDRLIGNDAVADAREVLTGLRSEIVTDQEALSGLLNRLGDEESGWRDLGGWLAEKAGRLKFLLDDPMSGKFERLEAFEVLTLGIHGKRGLWRALAVTQPLIPAFRSVDFMQLVRRADEQQAKVEALRLDAARDIISDADPVASDVESRGPESRSAQSSHSSRRDSRHVAVRYPYGQARASAPLAMSSRRGRLSVSKWLGMGAGVAIAALVASSWSDSQR